MPLLITSLISGLVSLVISVGYLFVPHSPPIIIQNVSQPDIVATTETKLGADTTLPIAGTTYTLSGSGVSSAATSIGLVSFTIPQTGREITDSDLSGTFYITLEPGSRTRQEIVSCTTVTQSGTDATATLSGCSRGLLPFSPYTASSTYAFAHAGGTSMVLSNPPQLYEELASRGNSEYITGVWTFASSSLPRVSSTPIYSTGDELKLVTYGQLASTTAAGTVPLSESAAGIGIGATQSQMYLGTATGTSGGVNYQLLLQNKYANGTSTATSTIPITKSNGKLSQGFLDLTEQFGFTSLSVSGTSTLVGTSTFSQIPALPAINPTTGNQATRKTYVDTFIPLIDATSTDVIVSGETTSTIFSATIPANTLIGKNSIETHIQLYIGDTNAEASTYYVNFYYGGVNICSSTIKQAVQGNWNYEFVHTMIASSSAYQDNFIKKIGFPDNYNPNNTATSTATNFILNNSSSTVDATSAQTYSITLRHDSVNQLSRMYYAIIRKFVNQ